MLLRVKINNILNFAITKFENSVRKERQDRNSTNVV